MSAVFPHWLLFWCPSPAPLKLSLRAANLLLFYVCDCMGVCVCVFSMCYLVIDYKRLFNFVSPHVGINLHSLSGVNGVSRWLARKIFEDCRLAGVCIQPPALLLLIDLLLPFLFSGCFGFSSFLNLIFIWVYCMILLSQTVNAVFKQYHSGMSVVAFEAADNHSLGNI